MKGVGGTLCAARINFVQQTAFLSLSSVSFLSHSL